MEREIKMKLGETKTNEIKKNFPWFEIKISNIISFALNYFNFLNGSPFLYSRFGYEPEYKFIFQYVQFLFAFECRYYTVSIAT